MTTRVFNRMIEASHINVRDFGAVGDGVTDDTAAIQAAIDAWTLDESNGSDSVNREFSSYTVTGGNYVYAVSAPIVLKGSVNIDWLSLRALPSFSGTAVVVTDGNRVHGDVNKLTIDGNGVDTKGVRVENVFGSRWTNINIYDVKDDCFLNTGSGYELFLDNFRLVSHPDSNEFARGLRVIAADGHYTNGACLFNPIGVEILGGSNVFESIHSWSGYYANGQDSGVSGGREQFLGFLIDASNNVFTNCQSDSPSKRDYTQGNLDGIGGFVNGGIGFYLTASAFRCKLTNCNLVINQTLYNNASSAEAIPRGDDQIVPWSIAGRDNSIVSFRNETKDAGAFPIYTSEDIKTSNTIIGCDQSSDVIITRVDNEAALTLRPLAAGDKCLELATDSGDKAGSIHTVGNFGIEVQGSGDQVQLKTGFDDTRGVRYRNNAGDATFEAIDSTLATDLGLVSNRFNTAYLQKANVSDQLIIFSPNGTSYNITVDNAGVLSAVAI